MSRASIYIETAIAERLQITVAGALDEPRARRLAAAARRAFREHAERAGEDPAEVDAPPDPEDDYGEWSHELDRSRPDVVLELTALERFDPAGRAVLSELQTWINARARRTAYVSPRPRNHGLARFVDHYTGGRGRVRPFYSSERARRWLERDEGSRTGEEAYARAVSLPARATGATRAATRGLPSDASRGTSRGRATGLSRRGAAWALSLAARLGSARLREVDPRVLDSLARRYGARESLARASWLRQLGGELASSFGHARAHLLMAFASVWGGGEYGAFRHLQTANLLQFQESSRLWPLDEEDITAVMELPASSLASRVRERLVAADELTSATLLARQHELARGASAQDHRDGLLRASLCAAAWLAELSVGFELGLDCDGLPPLDPRVDDRELFGRYAAARALARRRFGDDVWDQQTGPTS